MLIIIHDFIVQVGAGGEPGTTYFSDLLPSLDTLSLAHIEFVEMDHNGS